MAWSGAYRQAEAAYEEAEFLRRRGLANVDPLTLFAHLVDFVTPLTVGDPPMVYTNNSNDGRPFIEQTNFTACFVENAAGLLVTVPASAVRRSDRGFVGYPRGTNRALQSCDLRITDQLTVTAGAGTFTDGETVNATGGGTGVYRSANSTATIFALSGGSGAMTGTLTGASSAATKTISSAIQVWTPSGGGITVAKDQIGGDNTANSASRLTAAGANGRITHSVVTLASTNLVFQMRAKRLVGTGRVYMTLDNWATKTDVTALLGSSSWGMPFCSQDTITDPQFGIEMETSGDQITVEFLDVWSTFISGVQVSRRPQRYFARQNTVAASVAQSRPAAILASNAGSWNGSGGSLFLTPYAVYAEFSTEGNAGSMGILTGITDTFITVLADGSATFGQGGGTQATVPAGTILFGLDKINKLTAQVDASGLKQIAANGVPGTDGTGGTFPVSLAHIDALTNGVGSRSLFGLGRKLGVSSNLWLTLAQRLQLTT